MIRSLVLITAGSLLLSLVCFAGAAALCGGDLSRLALSGHPRPCPAAPGKACSQTLLNWSFSTDHGISISSGDHPPPTK